ncbi:MAG: hypothetical protein AAF125_13990, partial [Chloroflexota bacterium]
NRWFLVLIFLVLPLMYPTADQTTLAGSRRLWLLGIFFVVFFTAWGIGGLQPFRWAYNNLPGIGRWRFVGRALGAASFWLAILVALRADALLRAALADKMLSRRIGRTLAWALAVAGMGAAVQSVGIWSVWDGLDDEVRDIAECVDWVREQQPTGPLTIYRTGYSEVSAFHDARVRITPIEADYEALPIDRGIVFEPLRDALPAYALPRLSTDREFLVRDRDYVYAVLGPTQPRVPVPCVVVNDDLSMPFAFAATLEEITYAVTDDGVPDTGDVPRLPLLHYTPGEVRVRASGVPTMTRYVVVQETAYPGWRATVNGESVPIAPMEGYLGVRLPSGTPEVEIRFWYRPRTFVAGAWITLVTAGVMMVWLGWRRRP